MVLMKCVLISSRRSNSIFVNLEFTPCGRHALHSVRHVCERGVRHLSTKLKKDAAKIMGEMPHLISNHLENIMHIHNRLSKISALLIYLATRLNQNDDKIKKTVVHSDTKQQVVLHANSMFVPLHQAC